MELHLVHYKLQYGNDIGSALKNAPGAKDSLAVLGIMFKLQEEDNKVLGTIESIENRSFASL